MKKNEELLFPQSFVTLYLIQVLKIFNSYIEICLRFI